MTPETLQQARVLLTQLRAEHQALVDDMTTGENQVTASDPQHEGSSSGDSADDADAMFDAEMNFSLADNERDIVRQIDNALARIDAGSYGLCEVCGKVIEPERLRVLPYATLCLDDQRKREQEAGI
jgi:RNA polymerase-binding protein DksA